MSGTRDATRLSLGGRLQGLRLAARELPGMAAEPLPCAAAAAALWYFAPALLRRAGFAENNAAPIVQLLADFALLALLAFLLPAVGTLVRGFVAPGPRPAPPSPVRPSRLRVAAAAAAVSYMFYHAAGCGTGPLWFVVWLASALSTLFFACECAVLVFLCCYVHWPAEQ